MSKINSLLIASIAILTNSFVLMPAQASLEGSLQNRESRNLHGQPSPLIHSENSKVGVENIGLTKQNRPSDSNTYVFQTRSYVNTEISVDLLHEL